MGVLLTLDLNPDDMGKVIGKKGNTAKAIRTLLRVMGMKHHARVTLRISEPEGGRRVAPVATTTSSAAAQVDEAMQDLKSI
jgi:predicted RNA-binding protein Jag